MTILSPELILLLDASGPVAAVPVVVRLRVARVGDGRCSSYATTLTANEIRELAKDPNVLSVSGSALVTSL